MLRKLKLMATVLAASVFIAGAASAATVWNNHNHRSINPDTLFVGSVFTQRRASVFKLGSYSNVKRANRPRKSSITVNILGFFPGLTVNWADAIAGTIRGTSGVKPGINTPRSVSTGNSPTQNLRFAWSTTKPPSGTNGNTDVAAVPLPAGGLLLLTALGGLVLISRRKTA